MTLNSLLEILKNGTNDLYGFLWNFLFSMLFQPFLFGNSTNKKIIVFIYLLRSFGRLKGGVFRTSIAIVNFLWSSNWIFPNAKDSVPLFGVPPPKIIKRIWKKRIKSKKEFSSSIFELAPDTFQHHQVLLLNLPSFLKYKSMRFQVFHTQKNIYFFEKHFNKKKGSPPTH